MGFNPLCYEKRLLQWVKTHWSKHFSIVFGRNVTSPKFSVFIRYFKSPPQALTLLSNWNGGGFHLRNPTQFAY